MELLLGENIFKWVPVAGTVITFCAVVVAICALRFQYWQFKRNKEPVINLVKKRVIFDFPNVPLDVKQQQKLNLDSPKVIRVPDEKAMIPLYNHGETTVINLEYSYKIRNLQTIKNIVNAMLKANNQYEEYKIQVGYSKDGTEIINAGLKNPMLPRGSVSFYVGYGRKPVERPKPIEPGEEIDIELPRYFFPISSHVVRAAGAGLINESVFPELELNVSYSDINYRYYKVKYIIKVEGFFVNEYNLKPNCDELQLYLVPEFVSKSKGKRKKK
ncbi:hypothetical protein [Bacillus sp. RC51]|uniref:hypothetical protein n=1 Tax=Bacillus sp. RC51 TaxID=3156288 RepID=UPI00383925D0